MSQPANIIHQTEAPTDEPYFDVHTDSPLPEVAAPAPFMLPDSIVKNIYPESNNGDIDHESGIMYERYMRERLEAPLTLEETWTTTTEPIPPKIEVVTDTVMGKHRKIANWREWRWWPTAVGLTMTALSLIQRNAEPTFRTVFPRTTPVVTLERVPTEVEVSHQEPILDHRQINLHIADNRENDASAVIANTEQAEQASIDRFGSTLNEYIDRGYHFDGPVNAVAQSSDETSAGAESIGRPDQVNAEVADARESKYTPMVRETLDANGFDHVRINSSSEEAILDNIEQYGLLMIQHQAGYETTDELLLAYRNNQLGQDMHDATAVLLGDQRGEFITANVTRQIGERTVTETIILVIPHVHTEHEEVPGPGFRTPLPILLPPIPRTELVDELKTVTSIKETPGQPGHKEIMKRRYEFAKGILLLPEAFTGEVTEDGFKVMREHAWAYTRKYQVLLRDQRIPEVLVSTYQPDNEAIAKEIRTLFVDHEPSEEEILIVQNAIQIMAQIRGAEIYDILDAIAIMPSDNPKDPHEIGLSIDQKADPNVLGLAIPLLSLIEIRLEDLTKMSPEEFAYTILHEIQHHIDSNPQGDIRTIWRDEFRKLPEWGGTEWRDGYTVSRIEALLKGTWLWEVTDNHGNKSLTMSRSEPKVRGKNASVRRLGPPTNYGRTNPREDNAESAAVSLINSDGSAEDKSRVSSDKVDPLRTALLLSIFGEKRFDVHDAPPKGVSGRRVKQIKDVFPGASDDIADKYVVLSEYEATIGRPSQATAQRLDEAQSTGWSVPIDFPSRLSSQVNEGVLDPVVNELTLEASDIEYHADTELTSLVETYKKSR